jgi:hypothetical protein
MKKYLGFIVLLATFGCELLVDIDVPLDHQSITLNSYFSPDSLWSARLKLNRHILSNDPFAAVEDAVIVVYENGNPIDTLGHHGMGQYRSDTGRPVAGRHYEIKAFTEQFPTVKSSSYIPLPAQNLHVDIHELHRDANNVPYTDIDISFTDDGNEKNYYKISFIIQNQIFDAQGNLVTRSNPFPFKLASESEDDSGIGYDEIILSDVLFNGQEHKMKLETYGQVTGQKIIISVSSLSQDYYDYKQTGNLQQETTGDPFAQPVNVYNNIQGGFGIFAGYSTANFIDEVPKPVIKNISPLKGKAGDHVIIQFENNESNARRLNYTSVFFKGNPQPIEGPILKLDYRQIECAVPANAITGKIVLFINGVPTESDDVFEVIN